MLSRRRFVLGASAAAAAFFGSPLLPGCRAETNGTTVVGDWLFGEFGARGTGVADAALTPVSLPHCVTDLSWWKWNPSRWQRLWLYRHRFRHHPDTSGVRTVLEFDGVLSAADVYLNGRRLGSNVGGYLPFGWEVTNELVPGENVLDVVVDSRWGLNAPPNRPAPWRPRSIDFLQPGGISRAMTIHRFPRTYLSGLFAKPVDVLSPARRVELTGVLDAGAATGPITVTARLRRDDGGVAEAATQIVAAAPGRHTFFLTLRDLAAVSLWDLDSPALYDVVVSATAGQRTIHEAAVRIGLREARFTRDGFYLNGLRCQLFGLNRHEWYPYAGAAMPDRVHRRDAEILKNDLNCNMVRCSHYPQSTAFLDACDELGLLVWEEAPGWDFIGDEVWRRRVLRDVERMVTRDRNHPSIIVWGTRLNETENDVALYQQTRSIALLLDDSRPATGAVEYTFPGNGPSLPRGYRDPYHTDPHVQDLFAFNDYLRPPRGRLPTLRSPRTDLPYLVSEAVGAQVGSAHYRRTDPGYVQGRQALLHAAVHDTALSNPRYSGLLAWCAFDYPSVHSPAVDGLKWAGVADIFRIPKPGAAFYQSQVDPARRVVVEPAFPWPVDASLREGLIWSNCERLVLTVGQRRIADVRPDPALLSHLRYPPFRVELPVQARQDLRIDGYLGGRLALSRTLSADQSRDTLLLRADDRQLNKGQPDATRVVLGIVDRYGNWRGSASGSVTFALTGPAVLVGDNPLDLTACGGTGAVWVRSTGAPGQVALSASYPGLPLRKVGITVA
ncbi:glycoside hydrolase family 2 TIM barrel-domain containing protein [Saccharomonospora sp. NPDC046836]|uniref:glycoside hydrolase family 2 protein n=1 Tax=Saccharomonospora sp. NPDC046836 TaxID=3156921 RepID=UPI0033E10A8A